MLFAVNLVLILILGGLLVFAIIKEYDNRFHLISLVALIFLVAFVFNFIFMNKIEHLDDSLQECEAQSKEDIEEACGSSEYLLNIARISPDRAVSVLLRKYRESLTDVVAQKIYDNFPKEICGKCRLLLVGNREAIPIGADLEAFCGDYRIFLAEVRDKFNNAKPEESYKLVIDIEDEIGDLAQLTEEVDAVLEVQTQHFSILDENNEELIRTFVNVRLYNLPDFSLIWSDQLLFDDLKDKTTELYKKIHLQTIANMMERGVNSLTKKVAPNSTIFVQEIRNDADNIIRNELMSALIMAGWRITDDFLNADVVIRGEIITVKGIKNLVLTTLNEDNETILAQETWTLDSCINQIFKETQQQETSQKFGEKLKENMLISVIIGLLILILLIWVIFSARAHGII
jgi:hypothetical protein